MLDLRRLHEKYNSGLEKLILSNIERSVAEIRLLVKTRLETDENAREDSIIDLKNELRNLLFQIKIEDDKFVQEYKNKWLCGEM
jgi:hypothetical protein